MEEFESKKKDGAEVLSQYAKEHYKEYAAFNPDIVVLIDTIDENRKQFETEVLPNASNELVVRVSGFIKGIKDEEIIALLNRAKFDYEDVLSGEEDEQTKEQAILEAVLKARTYDEAVELNRNNDIDFSGFEKDPDIPDAKKCIYQVFGAELLQKCLISKIKYAPETVNIRVGGTDYWLPIDVYKEWVASMPEVRDKKFRAETFVKWNTHPNFSKKFIPTPINFYSFHGEQPEQMDYLADVPTEQKMRQYKLGTIAHEVAHHIYAYLMDTDKRTQWRTLVDRTQAITAYAKFYEEKQLKYEEFFTEAVRLKTTVPDYIRTNFPEINQFLTDNFPDVTHE